eukprot:scaffold5343_cov48-Phaeocystis_antarctica.AAC.1
MQARLSATFEGQPPPPAAGGATAALAASLSAFSAASASRTSLVAAPRSGCCCRSLASSGLKPRSGSATRILRTASRRASGLQGSHMRGAPGARAAASPAPSCRRSRRGRPRQSLREDGITERSRLFKHDERSSGASTRRTRIAEGSSM